VIFTGSRTFGHRDDPADKQKAHVVQEGAIVAAVVNRLIGRYVIGLESNFAKRDRTITRGPGLYVHEGGADGLDRLVRYHLEIAARGLRRRTREEFRTPYLDTQLADGLWCETFYADWRNLPRHQAGPERNQRMLDARPVDRVIAFFAYGKPYGPTERGGTNDMVRRAVAAGVPVDIWINGEWRKP
jgi:hypothetical protein